MFNPAKLFKLKGAWEVFTKNHPKFPKFLKAVNENAMEEGAIVEINVKTPSGKSFSTNLKLLEADMRLIREVSDLFKPDDKR